MRVRARGGVVGGGGGGGGHPRFHYRAEAAGTSDSVASFKAGLSKRVFAICQILLSWKTCKYDYETDELPTSRPTQPKENRFKSGIWATSSHIKKLFVGWDRCYTGNRLRETQTNQILRTLIFWSRNTIDKITWRCTMRSKT